VTLCGGAAADGGSDAVHEGGDRDGRPREDAADRGAAFPHAERPRAPAEIAEGVPYADGIPVKPLKATANEKAAA
jgi:hypothetical protein